MVGDFAQLFGEEIALCVFFFLSAEDLSQAALVNRTWMRIALDPQLWRAQCEGGQARRGVVELLVSRYQERKQTVPWREIYYIVFHQHKFSDKEKSVELSLDEGHTVARASHFLNVTVNCKRRMWPSASQPFHYFQIKIIRKHDTHMSVGITDRDWVYTGNLVGFGQKCYNYAFHSNGLLLDAGRDISGWVGQPVRTFGTGDVVGVLVEYRINCDGSPQLALHLFKNGQRQHSWEKIEAPPYNEIAFTVAINGDGSRVALNQDE